MSSHAINLNPRLTSDLYKSTYTQHKILSFKTAETRSDAEITVEPRYPPIGVRCIDINICIKYIYMYIYMCVYMCIYKFVYIVHSYDGHSHVALRDHWVAYPPLSGTHTTTPRIAAMSVLCSSCMLANTDKRDGCTEGWDILRTPSHTTSQFTLMTQKREYIT
jgi:hypothetical protein